MEEFPRLIESGNDGDGSPLTLGNPEAIGDLFLPGGYIAVVDWDGDGKNELVDSGDAVCAWRFEGTITDGTPTVDRGLRWGTMSRSHQRDENDVGLCGKILTAGDFDGDSRPEIILGPRGYSKMPVVMLQTKGERKTHRSLGLSINIVDSTLADPAEAFARWSSGEMTAFDWDGDGRLDLIVAIHDSVGYNWTDPKTGCSPEDQRDRYNPDGTWKGRLGDWSLHLYRNTGTADRPEFTYDGQVQLPISLPGGPMTPVDPDNPTGGLLLLDYYGGLWHLPLLEAGSSPRWGELAELVTLHGAPFTRTTNMSYSITVAALDDELRPDIVASDIAWNAVCCRFLGKDSNGRPIYDTPKKVKQRDPHVNGGAFSVPTAGDWRGTGNADLLVGSIEGYVFWYKTLSTDPIRFAPPERVRSGGEEIRRIAKPRPSAGYHWGSSQGPGDGFNGGYSNPVLVDWDGDGLLDLIVGDMIGLFDWYPNRGTKTRPDLGHPIRLHIGDEPLFGPWRVQPGAGDFTGNGLPDIVTMDLDLDLSLYRRVGAGDLSGLLPGVKLRYEDGDTIKTHGVYTPPGGDGRGRTKVQVVDWDGDGKPDLLLGVGPQQGSAFKSSFVLLCRNVGTNAAPVFKRPEVLLFNSEGRPLEFWRHGAHPAVVDWDGDGKWELVVGADGGSIWYFKPEHFGKPQGSFEIFRETGDMSLSSDL